MFVVVTLTTGRDRASMLRAIGRYFTPIVVNFAVVLATSAVSLAPGLPSPARGVAFGVIVLGGFFYAARSCAEIAKARRGEDPPHRSDFWCYGAAPTAIYVALGGVICAAFWGRTAWAPTAMAGLLLALLLLAIRNAWDLVTWIAPSRP